MRTNSMLQTPIVPRDEEAQIVMLERFFEDLVQELGRIQRELKALSDRVTALET